MAAKQAGITQLSCHAQWREAAVVEGVRVFGVGTLSESGRPADGANHARADPGADPRFVPKAQHLRRRFLRRARPRIRQARPHRCASGAHNVLMIGTPGSGKTMLTRRMPTILPPLTPSESLETTRILQRDGPTRAGRSAARDSAVPLAASHDQRRRHGRRRHHPDAGEISLAHHGVLFLDELPEFNRRSPRSIASAARRRPRHDLAGLNSSTVSREFRVGRRDESVPVRLHGRSEAYV